MEPIFGADLAKAEKQKISEQLRSRPYEYVAQEQVASLDRSRCGTTAASTPRSLVLRTYALNTGSGWIAMPGGLVRVAGADGQVVSMQRGGRSEGRLGLVGRTGRYFQHAASPEPAGPTGTRAGRPAQPRRRQSFLAGPLCRTG